MAQKYAKGTRAWGICGRSGRKMLLKDMVFDGRYPNMRVDPDWYEDKHPQEFMPKVEDPTALYRPSVEVIAAPTAPVLVANLTGGTQATLTWTPSETDITEIASYVINRSVDNGPFMPLIVCAVLRDFLGGIIGVQHCTTIPSVPQNDDSGSVYDKTTNEDAPITYVDTTVAGGHTYCYNVVAAPMGNNQSVAQGPPSAPSNVACVSVAGTFAWTSRGNVLSSVGAYAMASDGAGNTLLIDGTGRVLLSTDGGHTWAQRSVINSFVPTQTSGSFLTSGGTWILSADVAPGIQLYRSTNLGLTWTPITPGIGSAGGLMIGTDGSGNWVAVGNVIPDPPANYGRSTDDGQTWQSNGVTTISGGAGPPYVLYWTATDKWILLAQDTAAVNGVIWTSPDALTWTQHPLSNSSEFLNVLEVLAGVYYAGSFATDSGFKANSLIALASAAPVAIPLTLNDSVSFLLKTSAYWWALDFSGGLAGSVDFSTWQIAMLNLPIGDFPRIACYDAVHDSAIAAGASGFVSTFP
jgi:hypothetical protein